MIAKILVDVKAKNVNKTYDYLIPKSLDNLLEIGARVVVPFGNRKVMGFVLEIVKNSDYDQKLKTIDHVLDFESYLTEELIEIAKNISEESNNLLIRVLETMLPAALKVVYRPKIKVINKTNLSENLKEVFAYQEAKGLENIDETYYLEIHQEIKKGNLKQIYEVHDRKSSLTKLFVKRTKKEIDKVTDKQMLVLNYLANCSKNTELLKILLMKVSVSQSVVKTLEKHGYLEIFHQEIYRDVSPLEKALDKDVELNKIQEEVYGRIAGSKDYKGFLLHGVTGSGKTEIYLKNIERIINLGKSVILLVPEISLTPMMISRFKSRFSSLVAALHSGLSKNEKYDEWRRIKRGEALIVIGARSACFAPVENLGLIIVDECHESSYKQSCGVIYYAIDVLEQRAKKHNCPIVLGSATPNVETYARAKKGYYELLEIPSRALNSKMPKIEVVNMLTEFKSENDSLLSRELQSEIKLRLQNNEQTILLINRRGFANFVICRECGYVFKCPNCDISLTYHEYSHSLKCHYCNHEESVPHKCSRCGSEELNFLGSGTQKIEKSLKENFPEAKIYRMDNDTTRTKNAHEIILGKFQKNGDILIGTQMIAKGLDFPRVTLVGIIQADANLFVPDFRAPEKTFQLIMQVSGRSGRRSIEGKVIIQALNPEHYAIKYACENDYLGFYHKEMSIRRLARFAPYYFLININIYGSKIRDVFYSGIEIGKALRRKLSQKTIILGPAADQTFKINNRYQASLLIKYRDEEQIYQIINETVDDYLNDTIMINVDRYPNVG